MLLVTGRSHRDDDVTRVCRLVLRPPLPQGLSPAAALLSRLLCNITHSERSGQADTLVTERQQSRSLRGWRASRRGGSGAGVDKLEGRCGGEDTRARWTSGRPLIPLHQHQSECDWPGVMLPAGESDARWRSSPARGPIIAASVMQASPYLYCCSAAHRQGG